MTTTLGEDRDLLIDIIKRSPLLKEVQQDTRSREELGRCLDVSSATYYRYINWLRDKGLVEESSEGITLTPAGEVITEEGIRFERSVLTTLQQAETDRDLLLDIIRYAPGLEALVNGPRDRRELERRLDVSKTTSYRFTRSFEEVGLMEKLDGTYALTGAGEEVVAAVTALERTVRTAVRLGPLLEAVDETTPEFDLKAFADATVTTTTDGDTYGPVSRFITLLEETDSLRSMHIHAIAPGYIGDIWQRVADGIDGVQISSPKPMAEILTKHPERCYKACRKVCTRDNYTVYLHDDLPFGLVICDDRIGIGVLETDTRRLQTFVDTDSPKAREWAETVFESYKAEAVRMREFTPWEVQRAVERGSLDVDPLDH